MRVLFLTHRLPYAPNRGDRVRAFHLVRTLARRAQVEVVSLVHDDQEARQVTAVRNLGADVSVFQTTVVRGYANAAVALLGTRPLTHCLLDAPGLRTHLQYIVRGRRPDVVLAYCSGMARFALEPSLATVPLVLDMVDVDSAKWAALGDVAGWPKNWIYRREARRLGDFEVAAARHAAVTLVINERERESLLRLSPRANVRVVQNGVDTESLRPLRGPVGTPRVVFCGVMNYEPNVEGVLWFARNVWPAIRARIPNSTFVIVGANPVESISRLASADQGIEVTGTVCDVREYLWSAAVSVAPLLTARGLQNKVLEAIAAGLPVVVTSSVFDGLPGEARPACVLAESAAAFTQSVADLLTCSGEDRRRLAARAQLARLGWDEQLAAVPAILAAAAGGRAPDRLIAD